ncbi:MAG: hypothetical protein D6706_20010, partial [Chloroflexi bacterium]
MLGPKVLSTLSDKTASRIPVIITLKSDPRVTKVAPLAAVDRTHKGEARRLARMRYLNWRKIRSAEQRKNLKQFLASRNVHKIKSLWHIDSLAAELPPDLVSELAARPEVLSIRYDRLVTPPPTPAPLAATPSSNLLQVQVPELWNLGVTGQDVTVAIMDTGVDSSHPDLLPTYRGGDNSWFNAIAANDCPVGGINGCNFCDADASQPCDSDGHGTAVTGILVGGSGSGQMIGVAPDAQWIATKIFKSDGSATPASTISQAFAWLLDPDGNPATDDAPDVLNASWGFDPSDGCLALFQAEIQTLRDAGIAVVFSAGNSGPSQGTDVSPANYTSSYAVGSVGDINSTTTISPFSSRGPSSCDGTIFPDVVAPGYQILTTGGLGGYTSVSGTSFATPHVSGILALLLGRGGFPHATVADLEDALRFSATDLGPVGPDNNYGYGLVNAISAYHYLASVFSQRQLKILSPNGGGILDGGTQVSVSWTPTDAAASYLVRYTTDNGSTWQTIAWAASGTSVVWNVPNVATNQARIRINARDTNGNYIGQDFSDGLFTIKQLPVIQTPNGGET